MCLSLPVTWTSIYKIQISLENVLCMILWADLEHMWEIIESGEFFELHCYLRYNCRDRVWAHTRTILWSIKHSSTRQMLTEGYAQPPEHQNVPPSTPSLTHPIAFGLIFGFRKSKSLQIRPWQRLPGVTCQRWPKFRRRPQIMTWDRQKKNRPLY